MWPQSRECAGTHRTSTSWRTRSWSPTPSGNRASWQRFELTFCFSIVSSEPRAWPQSHDSRVGGHAHRTSSTTPRHPRFHNASPSGRDTRRRPSMAMRMHAIVAKQVCKPRKARCHTWNDRCANLGKHVVTPGKPGVQTSERMLPNLESQVCKPPKPFGQTHAVVLTNPRCHTAFL